MRKTPTFWATAVAVALAVPAFAQEPAKDHVKELIAQAMQQAGQTTPVAQPNQVRRPRVPGVPLSADDAVRRALERNLDIQVQRLEPQLLDYQVAALWATYRPSLTSSLFTQGATNLPTSQLQALGGSQITNDTSQWNAGMQKNFRWGGGALAANFNNTRLETSDTAATRNPAYTSNIQAQYTAAARNFRIDPTRSSLMIQTLQAQITDLNLRATLTITEASVRNAYWDLVFAIDNVEAARRNLELSSKLVQDNRAKVEIGTMAPIDVVQAQAEEATRRQALVNAEATRRTNELALKRLIVGGTDDDLWNATIEPTDRPATDAGADRPRGRRSKRAGQSRGPRRQQAQPRPERDLGEEPAQPDAPQPRPDRPLQPAGPRRHRVPAHGLRRRDHQHHPRRLLRRARTSATSPHRPGRCGWT